MLQLCTIIINSLKIITMKMTAATMVVMLFATRTFAQIMQQKNVPTNVKSTFQKKYPTATAVK